MLRHKLFARHKLSAPTVDLESDPEPDRNFSSAGTGINGFGSTTLTSVLTCSCRDSGPASWPSSPPPASSPPPSSSPPPPAVWRAAPAPPPAAAPALFAPPPPARGVSAQFAPSCRRDFLVQYNDKNTIF